ncbi:hypothetical protein Moror_7942 [Moniliophthora roreri MCA 2997]|uniref:Uncharacterized protein n=2 Tax=Moniliophthora roreri TaxID=221103 RepID=V2XBV4_MONRO|nr:hypothetical protein Moror_7942 [Moniliophthora roreri MCA 2997]
MASAGRCPGVRTPDEAAQLIDILFSVPLATFSALVFTYGFYTLLFIASLYVLDINPRGKQQKIFHIVSSTLLFLLVTGQVLCHLVSEGVALHSAWVVVLSLGSTLDSSLSGKFQEAAFWFFTLINTLAEIILIHRTWVVWGFSKRIIIIPILFTLANLATGIVGHMLTQLRSTQKTAEGLSETQSILFSGVFMGVNVLTNLVLTGLLAGRIWYIRHTNSKLLGRVYTKRYSALISIILESGALYPLFLIANIVLTFGVFPVKDRLRIAHAAAIISNSLGLVAAIAPTLIVVRAGLGISIEQTAVISSSSPSSMPISTLRAASHQERSTTAPVTRAGTVRSFPTVWSRDSWRVERDSDSQVDYLGVRIGDDKFEDSVLKYHYQQRRSVVMQ